MKYFLDTEFEDNGKTIELISVGIVKEDGNEFYAINEEWKNKKSQDEWLNKNVLNHLPVDTGQGLYMSKEEIKNNIIAFIGNDTPHFWGFYCSYDWVVFCQLFGKMLDLPEGWSKCCKELKQLADSVGNPRLPSNTNAHCAIEDARWNKRVYEFLTDVATFINEPLTYK
jgi:hypothetical protein